MQTSRIPKCDVGEGLFITSDPDIQIDGERLGQGYCKVYVGKAILPHTLLGRPRLGVETVGDALGRYVAWNICDVCCDFVFIILFKYCFYCFLFWFLPS